MDLLCACLRPVRSAAAIEGAVRGGPIDWARFLALATNHHVVPLVYGALKSEAGMASGIPDAWLAQLRSRQRSIVAYNLRAIAWLAKIQRLMESNGIRLVPIKGPALAVMAYGDMGARQFEDLDVIVRRERLPEAVDLLERNGYRLKELAGTVCRKRYGETLQNWSLEKTGSPPVDLKPVLISHVLSGASSAGFMEAACRRMPVGGGPDLWVPGPEAMLTAVCLDGANEMWCKLSAVADVAALLAKSADLDWPGWLEGAARRGQRRSLLVGAGVAEEMLGCEPPPAFREADRSDPAARRLARQAARRLRDLAPRHAIGALQARFAFRTRERMRDRIRFCARLLFVPGPYDLHALPLPGFLYPLHSLVRPVRLLWSAATRAPDRRLTVPAADAKLSDDAKDA